MGELIGGEANLEPKKAHLARSREAPRSGGRLEDKAEDKQAQFSSAANGPAAHERSAGLRTELTAPQTT